MSLLDSRRRSVTVHPQIKARDRYNAWELSDGPGVQVNVSVQPVDSTEIPLLDGEVVSTMRRIIGRGPWPGGVHSVVVIDGKRWEQVGEPRIYEMSNRTKHFDVLVKTNSAEVK